MTPTVGILGGGQLGRMLAQSAALMGVPVRILDAEGSPGMQISPGPHGIGSFKDAAKIKELASQVDVLTVEIEHIDVDALDTVAGDTIIHPAPLTLRVIQDKLLQKEHLRAHGCPVGAFAPVTSTVHDAITVLGGELPVMVKTRREAYDGKGNHVLRSLDDALTLEGDLYVEKWVPFTREVAVMVVRGRDGEVKSYPAVETVHRASVCHLVWAPLTGSIGKKARAVAEKAVATLSGAGVFGVEMFELEDGNLLINEIAPRPHNSGHYTIEACETSQYENHLRAILGMPLGSTRLKVGAAAMLNILGGDKPGVEELRKVALTVQGATTHMYGKAADKPGRKMGHITVVGGSPTEVAQRMAPLLALFPDSSTPPRPTPLVAIIMGSDSDLPVMSPAASILSQFHIPYKLTLVSAHRTPHRLVEFASSARASGVRVIIAGAGGAAHLPGMVAALTSLPVIGVPVATKSSTLAGMDALASIVQMPKGIPVATVAINGAANAGLLAVRILGVADDGIAQQLEAYTKALDEEVMGKVERLEEVGWERYLQGK